MRHCVMSAVQIVEKSFERASRMKVLNEAKCNFFVAMDGLEKIYRCDFLSPTVFVVGCREKLTV